MQEQSDAQLLREYAERSCEPAFREIVTRHADLVYSAALRCVNSPDLACDIAQSVFTDLSRKARPLADKLAENASLVGWLYRSTRFAALNQLRDDRRRLAHERQAMEQLLSNSEPAPDWDRIRPVLDEAMDDLKDEDRDALLLRYFKNHDFRDVGRALGVSDDAAQKRVSRAVEQLREFFAKRGVTVGASGLVVVIAANAVQAAPAGLAVAISTTAVLAGATLATTATATVAMLAGAGIYEARQTSQLREQNQALQQQETEQIKQLQKERDTATNQAARLLAENSRLKSDFNQTELLKLRGEIGTVRQKNNDLLKENQALQSKAAAGESTNQISAYDQSVLLKQHATDATSLLLDAIRKYAAENSGQYPEKFEQLVVSGDLKITNFVGNLGLNDFELAEAGSTNFQGKKIVLRLRTPIRNSDPGEQSIMLEGGINPDGTTFMEISNVVE
jgi:RNA polymerase sigma factor (sigma-70 family)